MYKSLNLEREKVCGNIEFFLEQKEHVCTVSSFEDKGNYRRRVHIKGEIEFFIDFHFLDDGSTTIDLSSGKKDPIKDALKIEIADFLKENSNKNLRDVESSNKWFIVENIKSDDFEAIISLVSECEYHRVTLTNNGETGQNRIVQMRGIYNEKLAIHYYGSNKKVMLQGRPLLLFNEAVVYFTQLVELEAIPKAFNDYLNVNVEKANVEEQYQYYFPNGYNKISAKPKKVLHQAIYNLQLQDDMYEYSFLLFPALRALEGHLKLVLITWGIPIVNNRFSMFIPNASGGFSFNSALVRQLSITLSSGQIDYVEKIYNFFNRQRHSLFHWADPSVMPDTTRMIDNIGEAKGLITDTFSIIDEFYRVYTV